MCSSCQDTFKNKHRLLNHLFQKHDISTFGDGYSVAPAKSNKESTDGEPSTKKTNQQQLEEQFQILDEDGNALQLSEADAEAIHAAMQQSSADGTLQIMQGEEGTMTVTVLTVAHTMDGAIQHIEQNVEIHEEGDAEAEQSMEQEELVEHIEMVDSTETPADGPVFETEAGVTIQVAETQVDGQVYGSEEGVVVPAAEVQADGNA